MKRAWVRGGQRGVGGGRGGECVKRVKKVWKGGKKRKRKSGKDVVMRQEEVRVKDVEKR